MTLKIKRQLISNTPYKYGKKNGKDYVTVHTTDNTGAGADAQAHANLQSRGNSRDAAWHWTVDDKQAIQSFDHSFQLWHAGDGRGNGNLNSIAVEICVNKDGDYKKAVRNAAELIYKIIVDEHISSAHIVQHNKWSGKNCPSTIRAGKDGITWNKFIDMVTSHAKPDPYSQDSKVLALKVGQSVRIKPDVTRYATGQTIASFVYGRNFHIKQIKSDRVLLKEINSWVFKKDVQTFASLPANIGLKVGQIVAVSSHAKKYATGQTIASFVLDHKYRIKQIKSDRVLLSEINSWVLRSDIKVL